MQPAQAPSYPNLFDNKLRYGGLVMKKSLLLGFLSLSLVLTACGAGTETDIKKQGNEGNCQGICPTPTPIATPVPTPTPSQNPDPTPSTPPETMDGLKELQAATGADETLIIEKAKEIIHATLNYA